MSYEKEALKYHSEPTPGKIAIRATKPCITQRDLSLAYTPGVAVPCLEIEKNPDDVYRYTNKGNLVAVVSNGTAVLGLGNIGPMAGKPVMEGKGVLFKRFAEVDVFDIELNTLDPDEIIRTCELLAPTFGGINLEDIKAPECFYIEQELKKRLDIPVFHDDQHGTAIISGAALLNALEVIGKKIDEVRVVFSGAGAAGIACAKFYIELGVKPENVMMVDSKGVIYEGREDLDPEHPRYNPYKAEMAVRTDARTLEDAISGAHVFAGVSTKDLLSREMVRSMADNPIIFAMANPDPEITYEEAKAAREDVIIATGRSDYPNQVNNVLGFPFIFRGALDVRAKAINEEMKVAAAKALASLAKEDVPDVVLRAYNVDTLQFGPEYLIPKPFDPRVLTWEALAVAKAAVESGVARHEIVDWEAYRDHLERLLGAERETIRRLIHQAQHVPTRIVFADGCDDKVLRASQIILDEKIGTPILLADPKAFEERKARLGLPLNGVEVIKPANAPQFEEYVDLFFHLRNRKGVNRDEARIAMRAGEFFGPMMVREGAADVYISGRTRYYPQMIRPMLQVMSDRLAGRTLCASYLAILDHKQYLLADAAVNVDPTSEQIVEITEAVYELAVSIAIEPRFALLSFSNFGSVRHPRSEKMRRAVEMLWEKHPDWAVDGEVQADIAVSGKMLAEEYPFAKIQGGANVLIFPNLDAANITFRLLEELGGATLVGPILTGLDLPMHILQRGSNTEDIVNIAAIGAVQAQTLAKR
ncbi:MAG TPA: NADP-dependent malic enzyme [Bacteroidetes bacterium]|nr:NADP-dependent malic enzyme [Bacteroidota bacterium]